MMTEIIRKPTVNMKSILAVIATCMHTTFHAYHK